MQSKPRRGRPPNPTPASTASQRVRKSIAALKAQGGNRKTFRLQQPALAALADLVANKQFPNETAAIEGLLNSTGSTGMPQPSLYPLHLNSPDVQDAIDAAVTAACKKLDVLFPGAAPERNGVSSNFAGTLARHIEALLTGSAGYVPTHRVALKPLVATDDVFGKPFALPKVTGCGYMAVDTAGDLILSAYSGEFKAAVRRESPAEEIATLPGADDDVLFVSHEAAVLAALDALRKAGSSPAERQIRVLAGIWNDETQQYVECKLADAH